MAASWNAAGGGGAGNLLAPAGIPPFGGMHTIPLMLPCPLPMPGMTNLPGTIADGQSGHGTGREDAWNSKDQPSSNQDAAGQMVGTKRGRGRPRKEQTLTGSDTAVENQAGSVDSAGGDGWLDRVRIVLQCLAALCRYPSQATVSRIWLEDHHGPSQQGALAIIGEISSVATEICVVNSLCYVLEETRKNAN